MNDCQAVIFDFDGVLVESVDVKTRAFAELYRPYGEEMVAKVVAYHLEHGGISRLTKFRYYQEVLLGKSLSPEEEQSLADQFSRLVKDAVAASPWVDGAQAFLDQYHTRLPLFVASGTPDEELKEIINQRGMAHYFRSVHGTPAKKGEIIRRICHEHAFEPARVVMVGDAMADYQGAMEAGSVFIGRASKQNKLFPSDVRVIADLWPLPEVLSGGVF